MCNPLQCGECTRDIEWCILQVSFMALKLLTGIVGTHLKSQHGFMLSQLTYFMVFLSTYRLELECVYIGENIDLIRNKKTACQVNQPRSLQTVAISALLLSCAG